MILFPPHLTTILKKVLFNRAPFTQYIMSRFQQNVQSTLKSKKHSLQRLSKDQNQSDMAEMLALSDQGFKTTITGNFLMVYQLGLHAFNKFLSIESSRAQLQSLIGELRSCKPQGMAKKENEATIINMLQVLIKEVDNMEEQMDIVCREMEIERIKQKCQRLNT